MRKLIVGVLIMLAVMAIAGSAQAVVPGTNGRIVFTRAVCTSTCSSWSIVTADPNDTNEKEVAGPYSSSAFDEHFVANWSPDGTELTFMVNQGIWTVHSMAPA
jgi:hypothetical protein